MAAMNEVSDFLPDTVLLDYIRSQIPSNDKLWTFRKHLAVQYACQVSIECVVREFYVFAIEFCVRYIMCSLQKRLARPRAVPAHHAHRCMPTE